MCSFKHKRVCGKITTVTSAAINANIRSQSSISRLAWVYVWVCIDAIGRCLWLPCKSQPSQTPSITAVCRGSDTRPDFNITRAEWHLTQVCAPLCDIMCSIVRMYYFMLSSFHFRLLPSLGVVEVPGRGPKSSPVCVDAYVYVHSDCNSLLLNVAHLFLPSLSSLFPVFSVYQLLRELTTQACRYGRDFIILLILQLLLHLLPFFKVSSVWIIV